MSSYACFGASRFAAVAVLGSAIVTLCWAPMQDYGLDIPFSVGPGYEVDSLELYGIDPTILNAPQDYTGEAVITDPETNNPFTVSLDGQIEFDGTSANADEESLSDNSNSGIITNESDSSINLSAVPSSKYPITSFFDVFVDLSVGSVSFPESKVQLSATPEPFTLGLGVAAVSLALRRRLRMAK